jgi:hypothetical protein
LVAEIASASQEQSQGISQVNTAVIQMDQVTQTNAASAEESASASEELNGQAESLKDAVASLQQLVGGASDAQTHEPIKEAVAKSVRSKITPSRTPAFNVPAAARSNGNSLSHPDGGQRRGDSHGRGF